MRDQSSVRRRSLSRLAGWLLLPAGLASIVFLVVHTGAVLRSQGYGLWPPTPNALATVQEDLRVATLALVGFGLLVLLPLRLWGASPEQWRWLRRLWALGLVLPLWAGVGLRLNRYDFGALWRSRVEWGPWSVPEALQSPRVWAVDVGLTLLAVAGIWALLRFWAAVLPLLATFRAPRWWRLCGFVVVGVLGAGAVAPAARLRPPAPAMDVVILSLDAFRADRLAVYGGDPAWAPHLNAFADDATVFRRAYCQEPWTLTSHMSMLTGLYPEVHGLDFGRSLPPSIWTLAERLRDAGWRTLGSVYDCLFLEPRFGYADGFDHYVVNGQRAGARAERFAEEFLSGGPAFGFLHFYDPHSDRGSLPYGSSPESQRRLAADAAAKFEGWSGDKGASEALFEVNEGRRSLTPAQRDALEALYNAGVHDTDAAVGRFLEALRRAGRYDRALIIVLADHGEALGEPSRGVPHFMHEQLIESTLHIPLLVKLPRGLQGRLPAVDTRLVETVDLLPTVCDALGLPAPEVVQGRSWLATAGADSARGWRRFAFARSGEEHIVLGDSGESMRYRFDEESGVVYDASDSASVAFQDAAAVAIAEFHRANAALARRFGGGAVSLSQADEALLRSLGYVQ